VTATATAATLPTITAIKVKGNIWVTREWLAVAGKVGWWRWISLSLSANFFTADFCWLIFCVYVSACKTFELQLSSFLFPKLIFCAGINEFCDLISGSRSKGMAHSTPTNQKPSIAPIFVHSSAGFRRPK
jgi:hypothetical protein